MRIDFSDVVVLDAGLLTGLLLALIVYLVLKVQRLVQQLKAANVELEDRIIQIQQVEEVLRQSEEHWQLALRGNNNGNWDWNVKTDQVFYSAWCKEMLGYEDHEMGNNLEEWKKRIHPDDISYVNEAIQDHFAKKTQFYRTEYRLLCKDGSYKWIQGQGQALWDEAGEVVRMVGSHTEITEIKQAQAALQRANQELEIRVSERTQKLVASLIERKATEEALREAHQRLTFHVENSPLAVVEWDSEFRVSQWSQAAEKIFGWTAAEVLGKHPWDWQFVIAEDVEAVNRIMAQLLNGSERRNVCPNRNYRSDGSVVDCEWYNSALLDESGNLVSILSLFLDVSDRVRAHEALRQSEQRYRSLVEATANGVWIANAQGELLTVTSPLQTITGLSEEEVKGWGWLFALHPDDRELTVQLWKRALETKSPCETEYRLRMTDGSYGHICVRGVPVLEPDGCVREWVGTCTDITKRKQMEAELRASEERFRTSLENMLDCFAIFTSIRDSSGRIIDFRYEYVNPAACTNNLMTKEEQIGKGLCELLPNHRETGLFDEYCQVVETGESLVKESLIYEDVFNQQRLSRAFDIRAAKLGDGFVVAWRDITMRKRAEEEVLKALEREQELNEFKSRIISVISHEYRTPLTTIQMSAGLLETYSHKLTESKKLTHFQRIQTAVKHLTQLVSDVLVIGEAEAGKLKFNPAPLDVEKFCRDLVEELLFHAGTKYMLTFISEGCGTTACLDEKLLRQILTNLLTNAIKYSPQGGNVHFELTCDQEIAIFRIQDQGIGIPLADQAKLFNAFQRATNVGTISGTGLGLSIVKKAVDLHRGKITFVSEAGVGTTFTVTLQLKKQISNDEKTAEN